MTLFHLVTLSLGAAVLLLGLLCLLVALLKKKRLWAKLAPAIVAVIGLTACIAVAVNILSVHRLNNQQNYAACELLEIERYEAGRDMAELANSRLRNPVSAEIITISLGLGGEKSLCAQAAQAFLGDHSSSILTQLKDLSLAPAAEDSDEYQVALLRLLKEIKNQIKPSDKSAAQNLAKAQDLLESGDTEELASVMKRLDDGDVLTMQMQAKVAAAQYDYDEAFELLEEAAKQDNTLPNRVAVAAAAAKGAASAGDPEVERLEEELETLVENSEALAEEIEDSTKSSAKQRLEKQLRELLKKIETLREKLIALPARKAMNYLQSLWLQRSWTDRSASEYLLAMSELYFTQGEDQKAEAYAEEFFSQDFSDINSRLTIDICRYLVHYDEVYFGEDSLQYSLQDIIDKMHQGFRYTDWSGSLYGGRQADFAAFLDGVLQRVRNSVHISAVETPNMQDFTVSVNISRENSSGKAYTASEFQLYDMGVEVKDFTVTVNQGQDTSVCMVVDYSGSMSGERLAAAKNAVAGFIHNAGANVKVGLAAFDSSATIYSPVTESIGSIARSVMNLEGGGGTNIPSGLLAGMQTLERQSGNKIIVLLTDGEDGNQGQMEEVLAQLRAKNIVVYAVGMGEADSAYMQNIANKTGGKFLNASSADQLALLYQTINRFISNDYTFSFRSTSQSSSYTRTVKIVMEDGYSDEATYTIGPDTQQVQEAMDAEPLADFFEQIGGSNKTAGGDAQ